MRADFYVTAVKTRPEGGHGGLSFLIIDKGEGVTTSKLEKLGWHASDTGEIAFEDVFVPDENLLGEEGKGFYLIMANFQGERLGMALVALGEMRESFERTLEFVKQREAFGRPIGSFQANRHRMAAMATTIEAARRDLLRRRAPLRRRRGRRPRGHDGQAATPSARTSSCRTTCLQLHGGAGT